MPAGAQAATKGTLLGLQWQLNCLAKQEAAATPAAAADQLPVLPSSSSSALRAP
jgi:hypothetical protein